jgi:hypothetical protein
MVQRERRACRRYVLALGVVVPSTNSPPELAGVTRDVGTCGMFFYIDHRFKALTAFDFSLTLPESIVPKENAAITGQGRVVRIEDGADRIGVAAEIEKITFGGETLQRTLARSLQLK